MARFDSPGDAALVLIKMYERTNPRGRNFTQWLWHDVVRGLLAGGYIVDEGQQPNAAIQALLVPNRPPDRSQQFRFRLTEHGERYLHEVLVGDDQNPVHIPDVNFEQNRDMMFDIRDRMRRGTKVFQMPGMPEKRGDS